MKSHYSSYLLAAILVAPLGAQDQSDDRVMRSMPISDVVGMRVPLTIPPFGSMLGAHEGGREDSPIRTDSERSMHPDFVLDQIRMHLGQTDDMAPDVTRLAVIGSRLVLSGPRAHVDTAMDVVAAIDDAIARPIEIEAHLFEVDEGERFETVLPPGRLAQLRPRLRELWSSRSATRSGQPTSLSQSRFTKYVRDSDVEVAQDQSIADPEIRSIFEGAHVLVEPHALPGSSDLAMYCHGVFGELHDEMAARSSGISDMNALDVPVVQNNHASFSGRVEDGGALLVHVGGAAHAGSSYVLAIEARRTGQRAMGSNPPLSVLPCSALTSYSLTDLVHADANHDGDGGSSDSIFPLHTDEFDSSTTSVLDVGTLIEMLSHVVEPALEEGLIELSASGGFVFAIGEAQQRQLVEQALVTIHDQWLRTASCEFETLLDAVEPSAERVFARTASRGEARALHRVTAPVVLGRPHFVLRGLESSATQDINVEIAQEASASDPVVVSTFSGLFASVVVHDTMAGLGARVDVDVSSVPSVQRRASETKHGGDLYLPRTDRSKFVHRGGLTAGAFRDLGDAGVVTVDRTRFKLRQRMRVTPIR